MDPVKHVTLVMLDSLLDTRLGVLHGLNPRYAEEVFANPGYFTRHSDDFSAFTDVTLADYEQAWKDRDTQALIDSRLTGMMLVLASISNQLDRQRTTTPFVEQVEVRINLYPYQISPEVAFDIESAVSCYLPPDVKISSTYLPLRDITLAHVKANYTGMIIYQFAEWMQLHCHEFEHLQIPAVTVIAPKLHINGQPAFESDALNVDGIQMDPYEAIAKFHGPLLGLEWESASTFSIIHPDNHSETAQKDTAQG